MPPLSDPVTAGDGMSLRVFQGWALAPRPGPRQGQGTCNWLPAPAGAGGCPTPTLPSCLLDGSPDAGVVAAEAGTRDSPGIITGCVPREGGRGTAWHSLCPHLPVHTRLPSSPHPQPLLLLRCDPSQGKRTAGRGGDRRTSARSEPASPHSFPLKPRVSPPSCLGVGGGFGEGPVSCAYCGGRQGVGGLAWGGEGGASWELFFGCWSKDCWWQGPCAL